MVTIETREFRYSIGKWIRGWILGSGLPTSLRPGVYSAIVDVENRGFVIVDCGTDRIRIKSNKGDDQK
jgi:hypothetical protein